MTTLQLEVYEAFRSIDIPDEKAAKVAAALSTAFGKGNPEHGTKIETVEKDISVIRTDIGSMKTDLTALKIDNAAIKGDMTNLRWMLGVDMTLTLLGFGSLLGFLWRFVT